MGAAEKTNVFKGRAQAIMRANQLRSRPVEPQNQSEAPRGRLQPQTQSEAPRGRLHDRAHAVMRANALRPASSSGGVSQPRREEPQPQREAPTRTFQNRANAIMKANSMLRSHS